MLYLWSSRIQNLGLEFKYIKYNLSGILSQYFMHVFWIKYITCVQNLEPYFMLKKEQSSINVKKV